MAEDFAAWAVIAVREGHHPKLDWLFTDFMRSLMGRVDSPNSEIRSSVYSPDSLDRPVGPQSRTLLHEIVPSPEPQEKDPEIEKTIEQDAYLSVSPRTRELVDLLHWGKDQAEIARYLGKSECWVSHKLIEWKLALAKAHVRRLLRDSPKEAEIDTRVEVAWLEIL